MGIPAGRTDRPGCFFPLGRIGFPARLISFVIGSDKLAHFGAYAGLAFLLTLWISASRMLRVKQYLWLFAFVAVYGVVDELLQAPVGRTVDPLDCLADWTGAAAGLVVFFAARSLAGRLWNSETESP